MSKILITGGAGFMGSHLVDDLLAMGHEVIVLDDLSGGFVNNINPKAYFIKGSITDQNLVEKIFSKNEITHVYHLAAYAAEGLSHFIKRFNYTNNLIGSVNLINESIKNKIECFIFTSSIAVYGSNQLPMTEDLKPQPEDSYGIAKYAVEQELKISKEMFNLNYIIFRPHNVYGPRQNLGDKYRNVVGIFMNQVMQGQPLTIFGDGKQTRAFSYISDVSPIIAKAAFIPKAYGEIFNIGADTPYTINELAEVVAHSMGVQCKKKHLPERNEVKHAYSSHQKANNFFNYKAKYNIKKGINIMAKWAKEHGPRKSKKFDNIEVRKNLPESWGI